MNLLRPIYGTNTAFSGAARLNNLPAGEAMTLGTIDNTALLAMNLGITVSITLAGAGVDPNGRLELYLLESVTDTIWNDGIDGDATGDQAANIRTLRRLRSVPAGTNGAVIPVVFDVVGQIAGGETPVLDLRPFLSLLVLNDSGATLPGSGHSATYQPINYEVVPL